MRKMKNNSQFCFDAHAELQQMSITQLNELYMEMEVLIRELSETLINELARRDELEYEKEMKNSFISLLLAVQNKRRQYHVEKKRSKAQGKQQANGKWLNAVFASLRRHATAARKTETEF